METLLDRQLKERKWAVIVDGYSTSQYYPKYFTLQEFGCIHITNKSLKASMYEGVLIDQASYDVCIDYEGDFQGLLQSLKRFQIACILPGVDTGVELADRLSQALAIYPNDPNCAKRCLNKYLSGEALKEKGVRYLKQIKVSSSSEALSWADSLQTWPVVVKPLASTGADGFHCCHTREELELSVNAVLGSSTIVGTENTEVLIQEYAHGSEYIVNTVSWDQDHYIHSCMVYAKKEVGNEGLAFEMYSLVDPKQSPESGKIFAYVREVLDAFGFKYGPAHTEVILTEEGPVLVECNARPHGHSFPDDLMVEALGQSQIGATVLAYADLASFLMNSNGGEVKQFMAAVPLISSSSGTLKRIQFLQEIEELSSFYMHRIYPKPGDFLSRTLGVLSSPGDVFLKHATAEGIRKDVEKIRQWEASNMFEVALE